MTTIPFGVCTFLKINLRIFFLSRNSLCVLCQLSVQKRTSLGFDCDDVLILRNTPVAKHLKTLTQAKKVKSCGCHSNDQRSTMDIWLFRLFT